MFAAELQRRYSKSRGISVVALHPGIIVGTGLARNLNSWAVWLFWPLLSAAAYVGAFLRIGTMCTIDTAGGWEVLGAEMELPTSSTTLVYLEDGQPTPTHTAALDTDLCKDLWTQSENLIGTTFENLGKSHESYSKL